MKYSEKLANPKWQKKRLEVLQRDNFKCRLCGDEETELQVNHLKYTGEPYEAPLEDLETLCCHCHYLKSFNVFAGVDGEIIKGFKKDNSLVVMYANKSVGLHYIDGKKVTQHIVLYKNSPALKLISEFVKDDWDKDSLI